MDVNLPKRGEVTEEQWAQMADKQVGPGDLCAPQASSLRSMRGLFLPNGELYVTRCGLTGLLNLRSCRRAASARPWAGAARAAAAQLQTAARAWRGICAFRWDSTSGCLASTPCQHDNAYEHCLFAAYQAAGARSDQSTGSRQQRSSKRRVHPLPACMRQWRMPHVTKKHPLSPQAAKKHVVLASLKRWLKLKKATLRAKARRLGNARPMLRSRVGAVIESMREKRR